jgi:hypothetical protein
MRTRRNGDGVKWGREEVEAGGGGKMQLVAPDGDRKEPVGCKQ